MKFDLFGTINYVLHTYILNTEQTQCLQVDDLVTLTKLLIIIIIASHIYKKKV